jgi:hypothetical protein
MRYGNIALILLLGLAMGCAPIIEGRQFDGSKTKGLMAEGTTAADVVKIFGEPQQKENLASGETKYVYYYTKQSRMLWFRTGQPQEQQRLEVFLKNGQVDRYRYRYSDVAPITTDVAPLVPEKK